MGEAINQMRGNIDDICNHTKMSEIQIAQIASTTSRTPRRFPGQLEANPMEYCNTICLRSGKTLDDLWEKGDSKGGATHEEETTPTTPTREEQPREVKKMFEELRPKTPIRTYVPPIPLPQHLAKAKLDE